MIRLQEASVSVIIPAYNSESFLANAIQSVLAQTHPITECLVIDDGSSDDTAAIASSFPPPVRLIGLPQNRGVSAARNIGITKSSGRYVAFLDADDEWLPRKVEQQLAALEDHASAGLAYGGLLFIDIAGRHVGRMDPPDPEVALANTLLLEPPVLSFVGTALVRREVLDEVGGFDEELSTSADCDLVVRILSRVDVAVVRRPVAMYRHHPEQMHSDPELTRRDMEIVFDKAFNDGRLPHNLRNKRARAKANLHLSLAGRYRFRGEGGAMLKHVLAACRRPDRVLAAISRLTAPDKSPSQLA